jgi:hypothetical protein
MLTLALLLVSLSAYSNPFPSALAGNASAASEASARRREINAAHDRALFPKDAPYVHDEMTDKAFLERFARETCKLEAPEGGPAPDPASVAECDRRLKQALVNALASRYFAVDRRGIEERCKREELACMDPRILELWIRESHNAEIEVSRKEKLSRIGRVAR